MRKRVGYRRHRASFLSHNGSRDQNGQLTTKDPLQWDTVISGWPCEFVSTVGGEILRGLMVTEKSTHAMFGNFTLVENIDAEMIVVVNGKRYGITSISDHEGTRSEMRVELRLEK